MNEKKLRQLNILTLIAVLAGVICMVVFSFVLAPKERNRIGTDNLVKMNDRWVLKNYQGNDDKLITLPVSLDVKSGETVTIMSQVPDDVGSSSVLMFYTEFQNVIVMLNDNKIYSNGVLNDQKLLKNAVPCYNVVSLKHAKPGDVITIYMASAYKHYSGEIGSIYYGTAGGAVTELIKRDGISFVLGVTLLVVTILLFVSLIIIKDVEVDKKKAYYAFGFVLCAVLWVLSGNSLIQLMTGNNFAVYMSGSVLILLMPILYLMYQSCFAINSRFAKIFELGIYVYAINFLVGIVFQMLSVCDFAAYIIFTKILITLGIITLCVLMYLVGAHKDNELKGNFVANVVIAACSILEAILSLFRFYEPYDGVVLQIGIYVFIVLLVIYVERTVVHEMNRQKDMAINSIGIEKEKAVKNINTSFVYSALNQVMTELKDKDREHSRMIYDASMYLKYNIDTLTITNMVSFSRELEYIKAYLGIQYKRNDNLEALVEDKVVDFDVPFNTIEPLVENAVVNGALKSENNGRIVVRSYERLDCFAIQIVDNGKGIGPDKKFTGKQSFKTIKKRLGSMCGATVEIKNKPDKGTILTIKIPKDGYIIKE